MHLDLFIPFTSLDAVDITFKANLDIIYVDQTSRRRRRRLVATEDQLPRARVNDQTGADARAAILPRQTEVIVIDLTQSGNAYPDTQDHFKAAELPREESSSSDSDANSRKKMIVMLLAIGLVTMLCFCGGMMCLCLSWQMQMQKAKLAAATLNLNAQYNSAPPKSRNATVKNIV